MANMQNMNKDTALTLAAELRAGYDAARLEIASLQAQLEAVGAGGVGPLIWSAQAQPVGAAPMGIVAVSPGCVGVGWIGGYVPKHNDKLYTTPQPAVQAPDATISLGALDDLAKRFADEYASPHSFALSVDGLRKIVAAIAAQQGGAA